MSATAHFWGWWLAGRGQPPENEHGSSFSGVVGVGWGREGVEHQKRAKTARR